MEFVEGHIYGYGRLQDIPLEFHRGFQIVFGLNESGKTTLFNFLLDMLFGQNTSRKKNAPFTENFYKYTPWNTQDYRGNLTYRLDKGKVIHLYRVFGQKPSIKIYEGLDPREITDSFSVYPNQEVAFIQDHLGVNREIFTGVATISTQTLESLGSPTDAEKIREHLFRIVDIGTPGQSIQNILDSFERYQKSIGTEQTYNRPKNIIRERLETLEKEYEQAKIIAANIIEKKLQLKENCKRLHLLQMECRQLQEKLQYARQYAMWRRKNDAKALQEKLDELTSRSFSYSTYRDFPVEYNLRVLQLEMTVRNGEYQKQKIQNEIEQITQEKDALEVRLYNQTFAQIDYIADYQEQFEQFMKYLDSNSSVLDELYNQQEELKKQIQGVTQIISELPEPIQKRDDFFQELDSCINLYQNSLKETQKSELILNELEAKQEAIEEELKPLEELFKDVPNMPELIEDYWRYKNRPEEEQKELEKQILELEALQEHILSRRPADIVLGAICFFIDLLLFYLFIKTQKMESVLFAVVVSFAFLYFMNSYWKGKKFLKEIANSERQLQEKIQQIVSYEYVDKHPIAILLQKAQLEHPRELQGLYDEYSVQVRVLEDLRNQKKSAQELLLINQTRTQHLFFELQHLFEEASVPLESEEQMGKNRRKVLELQEKSKLYHRKLWDLKEQLQRLTENISRKEEYGRNIRVQIQEKILNKIGEKLIQTGVLRHEEPLSRETFRAYYQAEAQYRELETKVSELRKKRLELNQQLHKWDEEISGAKQQIQEILTSAHINDLVEWKTRAARAEEAQKIFSQLEQTETQLQLFLGDDTLDELEQRTQDFVPTLLPEDEYTLQEMIGQTTREIEQHTRLIQTLQNELAELKGKTRPLNEIEEEKNCFEAKWKILREEQESVSFAMSLLQQVSSDRYPKLAQPLKDEISRLFSKLTNGKYSEVFVEDDLTLKLTIPETGKVVPLHELSLSQGTLEQLYFAMRIAFIKIISKFGETLPMLLDDPFSNYDYPRLVQALNTLKSLSENCQIILFTCRNDILDLATNFGIPVTMINDSKPQ